MFWIFGNISTYISKRFLFWMAAVVCVVGVLFTAIEAIDVAKRAAQIHFPLLDLLTIVFAKLPYSMIQLLPFSGLIAAMICFQQLSQTQELIAAQNSGLAPRQIIMPVLGISFALGLLTILVLNPISTVLLNQSDKLIYKHLKPQTSLLNISGKGIWFLDYADDNAPKRLIHAGQINIENMALKDLLIIRFHADDRFAESIRAKSATLSNGNWEIRDAIITTKEHLLVPRESYRIPTDTKISQLQENLALPENLSFWQLPGFINALQASGFSALRHKVYWYGLLMFPLFVSGLVLLGTTFAIYIPRLRQRKSRFALGLLAGFMVFLGTKLVHALGVSGTISPLFAAVGPVVICLMTGWALLLHLEGH